jgi:hypothetical protein
MDSARHHLGLLKYLVIGKPQHVYSSSSKRLCTMTIIFYCLRLCVLPAIRFDCEIGFKADEIKYQGRG